MKASRETKYKECMPGETVLRIKGILKKMGIKLEEHWGDTGIEEFHTLRVSVPGTSLGSNGKGQRENMRKQVRMRSLWKECRMIT
jgi:ribosomal protein S12 methylthiotransferase accessory factor YcaO